MSAFAQTVTGDLDISTGNLAVRSDVAQVTAWKLSNLFGLFKGEWFIDQRIGWPAFQFIFGVKNPNLNGIIQILNKIATAPPGVSSVADIQLDMFNTSRTAAATLVIITNDGATLVGGLSGPFIVNGNPS
jgi:hypothetical protein